MIQTDLWAESGQFAQPFDQSQMESKLGSLIHFEPVPSYG